MTAHATQQIPSQPCVGVCAHKWTEKNSRPHTKRLPCAMRFPPSLAWEPDSFFPLALLLGGSAHVTARIVVGRLVPIVAVRCDWEDAGQ